MDQSYNPPPPDGAAPPPSPASAGFSGGSNPPQGQQPVILCCPLAEAQKRRRWTTWVKYIFFFILFLIFIQAMTSDPAPKDGDIYAAPALFKHYVTGDIKSEQQIAVIPVVDVISEDRGDATSYGTSKFSETMRKLDSAVADPKVIGIVLRLNTPGGSVTASDILWKKVSEASKEKPVVASMATVAASGGYYIAVGADYIIAHPTTITGSIGVIVQTLNVEGLFAKIGVRSYVFKSGEMKDMLNPTRTPTAAEKELVQKFVKRSYDRFVEIIRKGREGRLADNVMEFMDGRILDAEDAMKLGLVDEIGDFEAALTYIKEKTGNSNVAVFEYEEQFDVQQLIRALVSAQTFMGGIRSLLPAPEFVMKPGRLYYLAETMLPGMPN